MLDKGGDKLPFIENLIEEGRSVSPDDLEPETSDLASEQINLFFKINAWRESSGMGPSKLSLGLLSDYCSFYGVVINSVSVSVIRVLDDEYLMAYSKANSKEND